MISSPSQLIGFAWLLAILVLVIEQQKQRVKYSPLLFTVLFAGAMLSKISHGVVGLSGLLFLVVVESISKKKITTHRLLDVAASAATVVGLFFAFYYGANNAALSPLKFPAAIQGELLDFSGIRLWVATIALLLGFVGFHLYSVALATFTQDLQSDSVFIFICGAGLAGIFFTLTVESFFGSQIYFLHSASVLLLVFASSFAANSSINLSQNADSKVTHITLFFIGCVAAIISVAIPNLNSGSGLAIGLRLSKSLVVIVPILGAMALAHKRVGPKNIFSYFSFGLIGIASMGVGFYGVNWYATLRRELPSYEINVDNNLGSSDLKSAMSWLRRASNPDDIFASNNDSFLLSALSHRRGYLQAEYLVRRHSASSSNWLREIDERNRTLVSIFADLSHQNLKALKNRNIRWVVIDKSAFTSFIYNDIEISSFENDEYLILDLSLLA
ncbi:MAG: hypothetical protein EBV51_07090 [Acidimicrobiia bacterium]|nr:hypothetical protein [Acidimicrobiia bacterium]